MTSKAFMLIFINLICSNSFALSSGPFYLPGGTVSPRSTASGHLSINLSSLQKGATFDITCDIENPNFNKQYPVVMGLDKSASLNGKTSSTSLFTLNKLVSKYKIRILTGLSINALIFNNYDDTDTVYVSNCIAVYATNDSLK